MLRENRLRFLTWAIDGSFFGQDEEHWRTSRDGLRAEDEFSLGVAELEVSVKILMGSTARNWVFRLSPERILG